MEICLCLVLKVMHLRATHGESEAEPQLKFLVMNSFSTSDDTMAYFRNNYPELAADPQFEVLQNKVYEECTSFEKRHPQKTPTSISCLSKKTFAG
jgi:hypothetical protein